MSSAPTTPIGADLLVRIPVRGPRWWAALPPVPPGQRVTVTLGRADLLPSDVSQPTTRGYEVVGVASDRRPIGTVVDVYLPAELQRHFPGYTTALLERADRAFDLAMGPVQLVLAPELAMHRRAIEGDQVG